MKKIAKTLIILICIGIFLNITISRYIEENTDISRMLGNKYAGGVISTVNYARIGKNFEFYLDLLKNNNYEDAYKILPYFYTEYKNYENFINEIEKVNYDDATIKNIVKRTENLYSIFVQIEEVEKEFLMLFNIDNTSYSIVPEPFLEYKVIEEEIKMKNVKYEVIDTINYVEKFVANIKIENLNSKETVKISSIKLVKESGKTVTGNMKFPIEIPPKEIKNILIEFETNIDFPTKIEISREIEKKNTIEKYNIDI